MPSTPDVYTDLSGLQNLRQEKNRDVALKKISQQFESMFIQLLLKNVRSADSVFEKDSMFHSQEENFYREMYDNQMALNLAHNKGFGIADALYRQLSANYGVKPSTPGKPSLHNSPLPLKVENPPLDSLHRPSDKNIEPLKRPHKSAWKNPADFVKGIYSDAKKAAATLGVDAETLISQAALETGWGKYVFQNEAGQSTNNLFNIKAGSSWGGSCVSKNTLEYVGDVVAPETAKFRSYGSQAEGFRDYCNFIMNSDRYRSVLDGARDGMDYIRGIQEAGYATDPDYADKIADIYQKVKALSADLQRKGEV